MASHLLCMADELIRAPTVDPDGRVSFHVGGLRIWLERDEAVTLAADLLDAIGAKSIESVEVQS